MGPYRRIKQENKNAGFFSESKCALFIIAVNVYVFFTMVGFSEAGHNIEAFILYPGNLFEGRIWTVITSAFIHSDIQHLCMNMLGILVFGRIVERNIGMMTTFFIYFGAVFISMLFATSVNYIFLHKTIAIIGASGGVMGLMSAAMLLEPFAVTYEMILPIPVIAKGWLFLLADIKGFLSPVNDGISHLTHLFGFFSIGVLVYFLSSKDKKKLFTGFIINIVSLVSFLFIKQWLSQQG